MGDGVVIHGGIWNFVGVLSYGGVWIHYNVLIHGDDTNYGAV